MSPINHKKLRLSVYLIGSKSFRFSRHKVLAVNEDAIQVTEACHTGIHYESDNYVPTGI